MLQLKSKYLEQIKDDQALQGAIAKATGKDVQAPLRWAKKNSHDKLTMLSTLKAIAAYNKIDNHMDLVEAEVKAA